MPRSFAISAVLAAAMTLTTAAFAGAATITYTNQAAFAAATSGITFTTVDFEGVAADNSFVFEPTPPGVTLMGANFTIDHSGGNVGELFVIGDDFYYSGNSVLSSQHSTPVANNIVITLPGLETALSLNLGTLEDAESWSWALSNGDTGVLSAPAFDSLSFFGLTSTSGFDTLRLTGPANPVRPDAMNIDDVSFGAETAATVPEPASMVLVGSALALAGGRRRRARRTAA
jgi:PEP-CTERM putative exosortase interaction domain